MPASDGIGNMPTYAEHMQVCIYACMRVETHTVRTHERVRSFGCTCCTRCTLYC